MFKFQVDDILIRKDTGKISGKVLKVLDRSSGFYEMEWFWGGILQNSKGYIEKVYILDENSKKRNLWNREIKELVNE